ncbi:DUF1080 domain-containing protein [Bifidobacterium callimiconis]|uniref:family 16 glycoside hydrolase n=1 Tax=Bifidobacterium callimiconis TaxID=2306973 RepID=UPI001BDC9CAF|nr:family 16 glycoside hydrolase [Bifidobacterium callimiconis]MBT1178062.1 DUF1080 domain-containing protein [Bifidobacterium callimiconis]
MASVSESSQPSQSSSPLGTVDILIDGDAVSNATASRHGLTFKGFGVLSGNATSSLLMDYKAAHPADYWRLVETLFGGRRPIMNLVKVEMGNDRNNSTGPNVATMRDRDEYPAVRREPGFQLAADARRYQPGLHVSMLRWHAPTWVHSNDDVYHWYKNTILAVYREYGYMVDTVNPDVNERTADLAWVAEFKRRVATDEIGFIGNGPDDPNAGFHSERERELFHRIRVITSDEEVTGTFGGDLVADRDLRETIDIASYHYSVRDDDEGNFTRLADEFDKEIWNSEAQATFSNSADRPNNTMDDGRGAGRVGTRLGGIGSPLEMGNTIIKGFVQSRRTNAIYQPAIGSFYEGLEYSHKELISARDPWSGWVYYDAGLAVLEHFCRFADLGYGERAWRAVPEASVCEVEGNNPVCGARHGEPSALTLVSPDGADYSTVIVNDSGYERVYRIAARDFAGAGRPLNVWRTRAAEPGRPYDSEYLLFNGTVEAADGVCTIVVEPWSVVTATTLTKDDVPALGVPHTDERTRDVLDVEPDGTLLYADDFDYADQPPVSVFKRDAMVEEDYLTSRGGDTGAAARYTTDTNGAFEIVATDLLVDNGHIAGDKSQGHGRHVLRQQIDWNHAGNAWIEGDPRTSIGDLRWANYRVGVDVLFEEYPGRAPYVLIGAREMGGSKFSTDLAAYDFKLRADGVWLLRNYGNEVRRGHGVDLDLDGTGFRPGAGEWNRVELEVAGDTITVFVNGVRVTSWRDPHPQTAGRVQLGTSFDHVLFDDLRVERVAGFAPYYRHLIDDMHMTSWEGSDDGLGGLGDGDGCADGVDESDVVVPTLDYAGEWTHDNGKGMYTYQRTASVALATGATVSLTTDGSGVDLFGPSDGSARFNAYVDGTLVRSGMTVQPTAASLRTAFQLRGLPAGTHRVTFELASGSTPFTLDAVGVL